MENASGTECTGKNYRKGISLVGQMKMFPDEMSAECFFAKHGNLFRSTIQRKNVEI